LPKRQTKEEILMAAMHVDFLNRTHQWSCHTRP
jgi:hypothetical protein